MPITRGAWVASVIFNDPPKPPPDDVPDLKSDDKTLQKEGLTVREKFKQHSSDPKCVSCHNKIDPFGFALENYDAIGKWRIVDTDSSSPIDSSGALPDGTAFVGPAALKQVLLENRQYDVVMTVIDKLLTYSLGRGIDHTDAPAMRKIMRDSAPSEFRLSSIIKAIIESTPFQMRRAPSHVDL